MLLSEIAVQSFSLYWSSVEVNVKAGLIGDIKKRLSTVGPRRMIVVLTAAVFAFFLAYYVLWVGIIQNASDIRTHTMYAKAMITGGRIYGHFLLFLLVALLSFWIPNSYLMNFVMVVVLSLSIAAKFYLSRKYSADLLGLEGEGDSASQRLARHGLTFVMLSLLAAFSILPPFRHVYLGQVPPTVYHNSTVIFLAPLALVLFMLSWRYLKTGDMGLIKWLILFSVLNIAAKPNYFMVLGLVFPLFALFKFGFTRRFWAVAGISALGGILMAGQFAITYLSPAEAQMVHAAGETKTGITVGLLTVWRYWSHSIPLSVVLSFAFPAAVGIFYYRRMIHGDLFAYAAAGLGLAMLMFMFLQERGPRLLHGNFMWQAIVCNYIVFSRQ